MTIKSMFGVSRRSVLAGASLAMLLAVSPVVAQDLSGELVIMQWQGGVSVGSNMFIIDTGQALGSE